MNTKVLKNKLVFDHSITILPKFDYLKLRKRKSIYFRNVIDINTCQLFVRKVWHNLLYTFYIKLAKNDFYDEEKEKHTANYVK